MSQLALQAFFVPRTLTHAPRELRGAHLEDSILRVLAPEGVRAHLCGHLRLKGGLHVRLLAEQLVHQLCCQQQLDLRKPESVSLYRPAIGPADALMQRRQVRQHSRRAAAGTLVCGESALSQHRACPLALAVCAGHSAANDHLRDRSLVQLGLRGHAQQA